MRIYDPNKTPIAVVGTSAVFPGSVDKTGFWNDIVRGSDLIGDIPETHWLVDDYYDEDKSTPDMTYAKRGAFLSDVPFDPMEWGVPPTIVPATDTTQLLALIVAKRVLQDALVSRSQVHSEARWQPYYLNVGTYVGWLPILLAVAGLALAHAARGPGP